VTLRAIGGLVVYNLFVLGVGAGVLWGIRGWRWWTELVRLIGIAYLLGLSALTIILIQELVIGISIDPTTMLLTGTGLIVAGVVAGRLRGFPAPGLCPPGWHFPGISLFVALFVAGIVVYFEALFRGERLAGVAREWDSWANWLPKSKALYLSGRLDPEFLARVPQQLPSYPPGPATIQAGAFHAMGSADTTTLHVQYWFFAVGFALAVIGLLVRRVHHAILFPVLLALLVAPSIVDWITTVYADLPLGYLIALAALLLILWIEEKESWQLAAVTVLLGGAMLTKREGMLFAVCVLFAGFVASFADRRQSWRRLFWAGLIAVALVLPWRIWSAVHGFPSVGSDTGYDGVISDLDRLWPALEICLRTLFHPDLWHFASVVGVAAIVLALLGGAWRVGVYAGTLVVTGLAAVTWVFWVNHWFALIHEEFAIRRLTGTTVLMLAVLTPLLLERAWRPSEPASRTLADSSVPDALFRPSRVAWVVVLVGVLSHPGSMLVGYSGSGLPGGWPSFPGTDGCAAAPVADANVRVVVGYADSYQEAIAMRERARVGGLGDAEASQDGCGRLRVYVDDVPTMAAAQALLAEAQAAGLSPTVELDPDD
jgi:Dolichyl-phosphate-mannose-protein mannosyltransferase